MNNRKQIFWFYGLVVAVLLFSAFLSWSDGLQGTRTLGKTNKVSPAPQNNVWYSPSPEDIARRKAADKSKPQAERQRPVKLTIGMIDWQVENAIGRPARENKDTYSWGTKSQAVYDPPVRVPGIGNVEYVYYTDGRCTSFSTTSEPGVPVPGARVSSTASKPVRLKGDSTTIRKGMAVDQVYKALGEPTRVEKRQVGEAAIIEAIYEPEVRSTHVGYVAVVYFVNGKCRTIETHEY